MHAIQRHLHHPTIHAPVTVQVLISPDWLKCIATIRPTLMDLTNQTVEFHMEALQLTGRKLDMVNISVPPRSSPSLEIPESVCTMLFKVAIIASAIASVLAAPLSGRALPAPVSAATARTYLSQLRVEAESNSPAYNRDLFKHWITISGSCDTRETVLKRDGTSVVTDSSCKATSGNWVSPYDNIATNLASDLDIDHVVPLKEAWVSGARSWTDAQRQAFANDLTRPQLVAVTDSLNQSKGDKDPAEWVPPLASYVCTYVRAWVTVKKYYDLSVDSAEKTALTNQLAKC